MRHLVLVLLFAVVARADEPRKPHPFAPSLPELTEEEEKKLDAIIDRFILYDTGRLRGEEGLQAAREFAKLGPESIPALIRGINRSAAINNSCPVTVIAAKLNRFFAASQDPKLLEYAKDEIGAGVGPTVHRAVLQDLRFAINQRKNALARAGITTALPRPQILTTVATASLIEEAGKERGEKLRQLLFELAKRNGDEVINTLGVHAASYDKEVQLTARNALQHVLTRLKPEELKPKLSDEKAEVRLAAVQVARNRQLPWGSELIERLNDDDVNVRLWAQSALTKLANGIDYGPPRNPTSQQRQQAVERWQAWWEKRR